MGCGSWCAPKRGLMTEQKVVLDPNIKVGDTFRGVLVETIEDGRPWSRVHPVPGGVLDPAMRVEFPKGIRSKVPAGTRFRATLTVAQKHWKQGVDQGKPKGPPYLRADTKSIVQLNNLQPTSERRPDPGNATLDQLRSRAMEAARDSLPASATETQKRNRSEIIARYARERAAGICEACDTPAPFTHRNGQPYLEVHHIDPVGREGADAPDNVAAICPNCHGRVSRGDDRLSYNERLLEKIRKRESELS